MSKQLTHYDKKMVFDKEVQPLVEKIESICRTNNIPFFFTAAVKNDGNDTEYVSRTLSALPMDIYLKNDRLINHIKVAAGFEVTYPDQIPDVELD